VNLARQLACDFGPTQEFPQLADAAASSALYRLLLVDLALCCQVLQESLAAGSSGQQVLPQQHHRQLLQELGVAWLEHSYACKGSSSPMVHFAAASLALANQMNLAAAAARQVGGGSSSSTANALPSSSLSAAGGSALAVDTPNNGGSSSSCCHSLEEVAMLTLLQAALLLAAVPGAEWFVEVSAVVENFLMSLIGPAREAAAAVMMQPFITQLLPASLTAAEAADAAEAAASNAATPQTPDFAGLTGADAAAASTSTSQAGLAEQESCLVFVSGALHLLLGTGGHYQNSYIVTV
jgi:hypothetical protein